jgi:hypothetical protein
MRVCIRCGIEKDEKEFPFHKLYVRKVCRACEKPNSGRKKKGSKPPKPFPKGIPSWNKGKKTPPEIVEKTASKLRGRKLTDEQKAKLSKINRGKGKSRLSCNYLDWRNAVLKKCDYQCTECHCSDLALLHAHHIIPWKDNKKLRFEVDNGKILCKVCHAKLEGFKKGSYPINAFPKGHKGPKPFEKGHIPANKGIKKIEEDRRICKICKTEKDIKEFVKQDDLHRHMCKICANEIDRPRRKLAKLKAKP